MAEQMAEETGPPIHFRIGINVGDIIVDLHHIYGDGVIALRAKRTAIARQ